MKTYQQYLLEGAFSNPMENVESYIIGLKNRLILMRPDEVELHRERLAELKQVLDRVLST